MAVARERHRVRHRLEHVALVAAAAAGGRPLERIVRKDEERLLRIKRLAVRGEPGLRRRKAVLAILPLRADEVVALHGAAPDEVERLVERLLPALLHAQPHEAFLLRVALHVHVERHVAVPVAVVVVVAGAEELLHLAPVRRPVVGEHAVPGVGDVLQPAPQSPVAQIARNDHGVDTAVAQIAERPAERLRRLGRGDVEIAHHAENEIGPRCVKTKRAAASRPDKGGGATKKTASAQLDHLFLFLSFIFLQRMEYTAPLMRLRYIFVRSLDIDTFHRAGSATASLAWPLMATESLPCTSISV